MVNKKVNVTQNPEKPIPTEVLATEIRVVAQGIRKMRKGSLNDKALMLLVNAAIPSKHRPGMDVIRAVFQAIDDLEREYLKKPAS